MPGRIVEEEKIHKITKKDDHADEVMKSKKKKQEKEKKEPKTKKDRSKESDQKRKRKLDQEKEEEGTKHCSIATKSTKKAKKEPDSAKQLDDDSLPEKITKEPGDFSNFRISKETVKRLVAKGITSLFPIQIATFDPIYDGKDVIGRARTGTGKTLSFVLPIVEKMKKESVDGSGSHSPKGKKPRVVVVTPTRELARQVWSEFEAVAPTYSCLCIYGGVSYESQEDGLRKGLDIVVGTPGRMMDHLNRGNLNLSDVKYLIMDEADHMLDIGFAEDMEALLKTLIQNKAAAHQAMTKAVERDFQVLLFSATLPDWIWKVVGNYLRSDKIVIDLIGEQKLKASETVRHLAIQCSYTMRRHTIVDVILVYSGHHGRTILFAETKNEVNELMLHLGNKVDCQVLHGDIVQRQRETTLAGFREGKFRCLAATDVAARGLDIPEVDLVIQCQPPKDVETYIHRSGRTGRAGKPGICIVFYKPDQVSLLKPIEKSSGILFSRIGAPQPADIIAASSKDIVKDLEVVSDSIFPHFKDVARALIKERGAENALCAALAKLSGHAAGLKSRSLLTCSEDFITLLIRVTYEIRTMSYIWNILGRKVPHLTQENNHNPSIRGMRLCADYRGACFDAPADKVQEILGSWGEEKHMTIELAKSLPELVERYDSFPTTTYQKSGGGGGFRAQNLYHRDHGGHRSKYQHHSSAGGFRSQNSTFRH
jgi:ATP-dependent RNA helicase DDX21